MQRYCSYKYIFFIIFMLVFFAVPINTFAAKESLGTCDYDINVERLGLGRLRNLSLTVTVYDDGSTGKRKITGTTISGTRINETPSAGLLLGDSGIYLQYTKMFDKNGKFYKAYEERNNCPNLQFIFYSSTSQLHFNVEGNRNAEGNPSYTATAESTGGTSTTTPSGTKTYCDNRSKPLRNSDNPITFTTTETNGVKEYTITLNGNSYTAKYNEILSAGNFTFRIREEDYNSYWSDDCNDLPLFLRAPYGDGNRIIQTVEPDPSENGSYTAGAAEQDYGYEYLGQRENNATSENWNSEIECEDIFKINEEGSVGWILNTLLGYIKIIGPILVVLLSSIDFIRAVLGYDEKAMKEAQRKLIIRLIAAIALFLLPTLIQLLLSFINVALDPECFLQ